MALEPAQRDELIQARQVIRAQLDELQLRMAPYCHGNAQPPDYRANMTELERELNDIEEILSTDGQSDTN